MMKPGAKFLSLAEELQTCILRLLPYQDILRCTLVCRALRQAYISSAELQYIVELGGQQLLPALNDHASTSISKRLQLLRDKTHAWFEFDIHSFEKVYIPGQFHGAKTSLANGHLCLWDQEGDSAKIFPILPKPSQQTIERNWPPGSLCSLPNACSADVFIDPAQNLIAIAYYVTSNATLRSDDQRFFIELGTLDGDGVHPKAAGRTLFLSRLPGRETNRWYTENLKLEGMGRHIALRRSMSGEDVTSVIPPEEIWSLQIWDWQYSTTSSSILSGTTMVQDPDDSMDFCFLGYDRLLTASDDLKLYSIEDMSRSPQLLACFLLPVSMTGIQCLLPMDDIAPNSQMQAQSAMWTSDPENRLLSLVTNFPNLILIVSTRIFFDLGLSGGTAAGTPWEDWGPLHARVFEHHWGCKVGVSGNRVVQSFPVNDMTEDNVLEYRLHMMDFSPSAVERRQGLGRVVTEPSTVEITEPGEERTITSSLPYVEVASDRTFGADELVEIWVDRDKIYLPKDPERLDVLEYLEVIEI